MQYTKTVTNETTCLFDVTLEGAEIKTYMDTALKELKKSAPKKFSFAEASEYHEFLEKVTDRALEILISSCTRRITEKEKCYPVARPLWKCQTRPVYEKDYAFQLELDILPQIEFQDFAEITLNVQEPDAPQYEIFMAIEKLMRPVSKLEEVTENRLPESGDLVVAKVHASYDNKPFVELDNREFAFPISYVASDGKLKEIENICRTLKVGEQKSGIFTNDSNYPDPKLRGKEIPITVEVTKLYKRNIPALTDEIAKQLDFADARTLKAKAYTTVMNERVLIRREEANEKLLSMLLENTTFSVPRAIYQLFLSKHLNEIKDYFLHYRYTKEQINAILEQAKEEDQKTIYENAKRHTYLLAYAYSHGISISDKDMKKQLEEIAKQNNTTIDVIKAEMQKADMLDTLEEQMMASKAFEKIYAKIKKVMVNAEGIPVTPNKSPENP